MSDQLIWSMQNRRDTASNWATYNPILLDGQIGIETDTQKIKIGTGDNWNDTDYFNTGLSSVGFSDITGNASDNSSLVDFVNSQIPQVLYSQSVNSSATPTPIVNANINIYRIIALSQNAVFQNPNGTNFSDGEILYIEIINNTTTDIYNILFTGKYHFNSGVSAPVISSLNKSLFLKFIYRFTGDFWDCVLNTDAIGVTPITYDADAVTFFSYLSPAPSDIQKNIYNNVFISLKRTGNWNMVERIYLLACETQQHSTISLKNPATTPLSEINSPSWTQYRGYTGDGVTSYIETHYSMNSSSVFLQDDASFGVYIIDNVSSITQIDCGVINSTGSNNGSILNSKNLSDAITSLINCNSAITSNGSIMNSQGLTSISRSSSTVKQIHKNGIFISNVNETSTGKSADTIPLLGFKYLGTMQNFSTRGMACAFFGNGQIDQSAIYQTIQTYMNSIGTGV